MATINYAKKWIKTSNGEFVLKYNAENQEGTAHVYQISGKWGIVINTTMMKKDFGLVCNSKQEVFNKAKELIREVVG